ncbi:hypothetical protein IW140_005089 [Coemansia sp. RSA 1813]|nr:hypothetical protein EV178_005102 [Coemansia sp. RSA 1646]KAJ1768310.1 hypothetical protein LPJ74_004908 [Coemansia sp. RSA 1843]KAJ2089062.1 hypothetical protein IW138_003774 [Coemansia sp. RSA 986]KAJ2566047.1 hypothetical protein IW140_005089 [Coemansia sp. RSA 1813]
MFSSELEVSRFKGAAIKTISSICGQIKKAAENTGMFRATFKDRIKISDIMFLRAFYKIPIKQFHSPITSLLSISKALQAELPFKSKPKIVKTDVPTKRAVIMDKNDKQAATLFNEINLLSKEKAKKQKKAQKQQVEHMKKLRAAEEEADARHKKKRKSFFRREGQNEMPC